MHIIVIGCGVSGLSSGVRLLEGGHDVSIWARDLPPHTTSNIAAAIWHPYKAYPVERVTDWGQRTLGVLYGLAEAPEKTGVKLAEALEVFREPVDDPWWRECVPDFRQARPDELFADYWGGYVFQTIVAETRIYLEYLVNRFKELGGEIEQREVTSLEEPLSQSQVVVNCAGLGARSLVGDEGLFPIRGQIIRVAKLRIERVMLDEDEEYGVTYIVPRSTDCILGGTAQVGDWTLESDAATAEAIIERCAHLAPEVRDAQVLEHLVGLRPGRDVVRLEKEAQPNGKVVVHNYGHGGAGITLSWGCAEEVASLVAGL